MVFLKMQKIYSNNMHRPLRDHLQLVIWYDSYDMTHIAFILCSHSTFAPYPCSENFIFLKLFYSNEIQNVEVKSSVVGLFEFRVENSFLIIHVSIRLVTYFWVLVLTPILCQHYVIQNLNKLTNTRLYIRYSSSTCLSKRVGSYKVTVQRNSKRNSKSDA